MVLEITIIIGICALGAFVFGRQLAISRFSAGVAGAHRVHSLPGYHGYFAAWLVGVGGLLIAASGALYPGLIGNGVLFSLVGWRHHHGADRELQVDRCGISRPRSG